MFGRNKKEEVLSWADQKMDDLYDEWHSIFNALRNKTKEAYLKAEALKVYDLTKPDGEKAQTDLDKAKHSLVCSIGRYDRIVAEIERHYKEHRNEMQRNWSINFPSSHEQIEFTIHEILRGKF